MVQPPLEANRCSSQSYRNWLYKVSAEQYVVLASHRRFVLEAFQESCKDLQIDQSELTQFYLDDAWLKELQKLIFTPGGDILVYQWIMHGISMLSLMNWMSSDIFTENTEHKIYNQTSNTRTEEQVRRCTSKEVREPPREWSKL